jgi:hypothetical protein
VLEGALRSSNAQYEPSFVLDRIGVRLLEVRMYISTDAVRPDEIWCCSSSLNLSPYSLRSEIRCILNRPLVILFSLSSLSSPLSSLLSPLLLLLSYRLHLKNYSISLPLLSHPPVTPDGRSSPWTMLWTCRSTLWCMQTLCPSTAQRSICYGG